MQISIKNVRSAIRNCVGKSIQYFYSENELSKKYFCDIKWISKLTDKNNESRVSCAEILK